MPIKIGALPPATAADDEPPLPILYIDDSAAATQLARVAHVKATRDATRVAQALDALEAAARGSAPLMEPMLDAARAYATVGEMCDALRNVWGEYQERFEI